MEADSDSCKIALHLEPFIHQVGGHSSMLQLDESTICKPLIPQELQFYQKSPESLKKFMPEFKGIVEVTFSTDSEGYLSLVAYMPPDYIRPGENIDCPNYLKEKNKTKVKHRIRLCQSGNILIESDSGEGQKQMFEEGNQAKCQTNGTMMNPWVLRCHQEQLKKMRKSSFVSTQKYMLLENLASKYEFPCILDLKMGTRAYGDDASMAKRQGLSAKSASTTSAALGVRIGGIQVYRHDSGHYICHNKYYGRGLTVDGFHQALFHFLHDGTELRKDVISQLLHKLQKLRDVIQNLDTFRFFTGSLLIIYDGKKHPEDSQKNCFCSCCYCITEGNDFCENGNMNERNLIHVTDSCAATAGPCGEFCKRDLPSKDPVACSCESSGKEDLVDVRMIDFAHSTQAGLTGSQNVHSGPDDGYLFGLENLISQLQTFHGEGD